MKRTISSVVVKKINKTPQLLLFTKTNSLLSNISSLQQKVQQFHQQNHFSLFNSSTFNTNHSTATDNTDNNNNIDNNKQFEETGRKLNQLHEIYNQLNKQDLSQMKTFYKSLFIDNHAALAIVYNTNHDPTITSSQQQQQPISFFTLNSPNATSFVPIFTNMNLLTETLEKYKIQDGSVNIVLLGIPNLLNYVDKCAENDPKNTPDILLNPNHKNGELIFTKSKIKKLLAGKLETIERELLKEDEFPENLMERLNKEFIEKNKTVVTRVDCKVLDGPDMYFLMEIGLNKESIIGNEDKPVLTNELVQFINETEGIPSLKYPYFVTFKF
ncbi:hypothetical protein ABK040_003544 [Willaertia magna]